MTAKRRLLTVALLLPVFAGRPTLGQDVHDLCRAATVRVRNGNSLGSGTVFRASERYCYVLTNAHVAGTRLGTRVQCEFWRAGHQSRPVPGQTVAVAYVRRAYRDIAVVRIDRRLLGGYLPPVIPLASREEQADYRRLFSVGCPSGRWPTAFEGFALRRNAAGGDTIHFVPAPAGGRSGSALFDVAGKWPRIIGLVAWRSSADGGHGLDGRGEKHGYGIAMTHQEVWAGLSGKRLASNLAAPPGVVPVQHTEEPTPAESATAAKGAPERSIAAQQRAPQKAPLETGGSDDVILLYSDPVAIGPKTEPPALAGGCEDGRCDPPGQTPGQLFPSFPNEPERRIPPRLDPLPRRDWIAWAIAAVAVAILLGRLLWTLPGLVIDWLASRLESRIQPPPAPPVQPPPPPPETKQ